MSPGSNKCERCGKVITDLGRPVFLEKLLSFRYCHCGGGNTLERDFENFAKTVKTTALAPEVESEYFDSDLKNRYRIKSCIGSGGGGILYRVVNRETGDDAVLKLIKRDLPELAKQRFEMEAKACELISHPNVIGIVEHGITSAGVNFIVMPFCEGVSLRMMFQHRQIKSAVQMLDIFRQVCAGLEASHRAGIVHRDMKPENVIVDTVDGGYRVRIIDFGIAKVVPTGGEIQGLTQTGEIFGTPAYMSPEQCAGKVVDVRTDIYSVGCMLFEAFAGYAPFRAENAFLTLTQHMEGAIPHLPEPGILDTLPKRLDVVIQTCLAKSAEDRYQSASELSNEISAMISAENSLFARSTGVFKLGTVASRQWTAIGFVALIVVLFGIVVPVSLWKESIENRKEGAEVQASIDKLEKAIRYLDHGEPRKSIKLTTEIIDDIESYAAKPTVNAKSKPGVDRSDPTYGVILKEALYVRGFAHTMVKEDPLDDAQADLERCVSMNGNDTQFRSTLAFIQLLKQDKGSANRNLSRVRPSVAVLQKKLENPPGFNDGWNHPSIYDRIGAAKQEVVFQTIVKVYAENPYWTQIEGIEIKPENRLWIDSRDDGYWCVGVNAPHGKQVWTDADGYLDYRRVHEQPVQCLLGAVGDSHSFFVGRHMWDGIAPGVGRLRLICNDGIPILGNMTPSGFERSVIGDNRGAMHVRVIVTRPVDDLYSIGWSNQHLGQLLRKSNQRIVYATVMTVDARNPQWTQLLACPIKKGQHVWLDCQEGQTAYYLAHGDRPLFEHAVNADGRPNALLHGFPLGALIGTIGDDSPMFTVGKCKPNIVAPASGMLKLIFNDGIVNQTTLTAAGGSPGVYEDNAGFYTVRVVATEPK